MLGLALLYFIWKYYSELAVQYKKNKWGYALLGIATYYGGAFLGGIIVAVIGVTLGKDVFENMNNAMAGLIAFPFGILSVWGLYKILQRNWSRAFMDSDGESLDGDLINTDTKTLD